MSVFFVLFRSLWFEWPRTVTCPPTKGGTTRMSSTPSSGSFERRVSSPCGEAPSPPWAGRWWSTQLNWRPTRKPNRLSWDRVSLSRDSNSTLEPNKKKKYGKLLGRISMLHFIALFQPVLRNRYKVYIFRTYIQDMVLEWACLKRLLDGWLVNIPPLSSSSAFFERIDWSISHETALFKFCSQGFVRFAEVVVRNKSKHFYCLIFSWKGEGNVFLVWLAG